METRETTGSAQPLRMGSDADWGRRLIAGLAIGLALATVYGLVSVFYLGQPVNQFLSWRSDDIPALPRAMYQPVKLIGVHYFGDFQEGMSWGYTLVKEHVSPYSSLVIYLPAAMLPFIALAFLPLKTSFIIFTVATALGMLVPIWLMTRAMRTTDRLLIVCLLGAMSVPFLSTMDRGNLQGIVIAAVGFSLWAASTNRWRLMAGLLVLAICLKGYPIVLLVIPLAYRRWRLVTVVTLAAVGISMLLFALLPGGMFQNIGDYMEALKTYSGRGSSTHNYSFMGPLHHLLALRVGDTAAFDFLGSHPSVWILSSLVWLLMIWVVIVGRRVPQWCWGPLALASLQVLPPLSFAYSLSWAVLAGVWFIRGTLIPDPPDSLRLPRVVLAPWEESTLRILTMACLLVTLTPIAIMVTTGTTSTLLSSMLSPVLIFITGVVAVALTVQGQVRERYRAGVDSVGKSA
jgi:hypothetical protein